MKTKMILPSILLTDNEKNTQMAFQKARAMEENGADGILVWDSRASSHDQEETLIRFLGDITKGTDTLLTVFQVFPRFEDIKKILYAGASRIVMNPLEGGRSETMKEGIARFGQENVLGTFFNTPVQEQPQPDQFKELIQITGCSQWLMARETFTRYKDVIFEQKLSVILCLEAGPLWDISESFKELSQLLAIPQVSGITWIDLSLNPGNFGESEDLEHCREPWDGKNCPGNQDFTSLKKDLKAAGIPVQVFESAIPFSEFKKNSDGLVPVVTQDYKTGKVLMLAYMNEESYNETIRSGRMTYYSRSRQCLWKKGDTSGHYQFVRSLDIDCDKDTILAKVKQIGAACHTGNESCFFTNLVKKDDDDVNPAAILQEIMDTVTDRKLHPKEGSYTNYLFDKGIDKILKKVGEEATEIVIAAKNPDPAELKYEISDFLYHMIVLMAEKRLTWDEIFRELAKRH